MRRIQALISALVFTAGISLAQVTGTVWENVPDSSNAADPANMGSSLASANFTSTGILYCSDTGEAGCPATSGYTVSAFLQTSAFTSQVNGFDPNAALNNTEVELMGTIALTAGANSFDIGHDDGATLQITGGPGTTTCSTQSGALCVNTPGPTGFADTPFTITPTVAGNYTFTLDYAECCGAPAYLLFAFPNGTPIGSVPEPGSIALLGTAVCGVVWGLRRRRKA